MSSLRVVPREAIHAFARRSRTWCARMRPRRLVAFGGAGTEHAGGRALRRYARSAATDLRVRASRDRRPPRTCGR
jgi:hypothetical protein